jgi:apolipoprotein N-acyltransferase
VPWLAVLDGAASLREALGAGWLMAAAFTFAVFGWFATAIQTYTGLPWAAAAMLLLVLAPLLQPQFIVFALARQWNRRGGATPLRWAAVTGACMYVGAEWASPKLFGDTLGHGLYASKLMRQAADVAGASGLTFVLLVANECAWAVFRIAAGAAHRRRAPLLSPALAPAACVATLVLSLLAYGALRCRQVSGGPLRDRVTVGVVQADISHYDRLRRELGTFEAVRRILGVHFGLSQQALGRGKLDLLVWPETVYPVTFGTPKTDAAAAFDRDIGAFVNGTGIPLVFGAYDADHGHEFNAAVFLEPAGHGRVTYDTYHKESLFPLTERVPPLLDSRLVRRWLPWLGTWQPGRGARVLSLTLPGGRTLRIAPLICYDAVDPSHAIDAVRQGAELIVTLSNDSWFAAGAGPRLHLVVSAFRSIETRRPQVRATNTGISAFITPTGDLTDTLGVDRRGTLVARLTPEDGGATLMLLWGDWFGPTALVCGIVLLFLRRPRATAAPGTR